MKLINIGFGSLISAQRLLAVIAAGISPNQTHDPGGQRAGRTH